MVGAGGDTDNKTLVMVSHWCGCRARRRRTKKKAGMSSQGGCQEHLCHNMGIETLLTKSALGTMIEMRNTVAVGAHGTCGELACDGWVFRGASPLSSGTIQSGVATSFTCAVPMRTEEFAKHSLLKSIFPSMVWELVLEALRESFLASVTPLSNNEHVPAKRCVAMFTNCSCVFQTPYK